MSAPLSLPVDTSVIDAITAMRAQRVHLTVVTDAGGVVGLITLEDLLEEVIGEFDDETDPIIDAARRAGRTTTGGR